MDAHPERLGGLDGGDHVLVAGDQDRVAHGVVPGEGLQVAADLGVDALLLPAGVEVAQAHLYPGKLGDHSLVDRGHPVAGRVVPVDPQQLAGDALHRVLL